MLHKLINIYSRFYTSQYSMFDYMVKHGYEDFNLVSNGRKSFTYQWKKKNGEIKYTTVFKTPFWSYGDEFMFYRGTRKSFLTSEEDIKKLNENKIKEGTSKLTSLKTDWEIKLIDFHDELKNGGVLTRTI